MSMKDEKIPSGKIIYKLWWEYLKRSDKYKEFCERGFELGCDYWGDAYRPFIGYLKTFGNIFEQEFEDWWNSPRRKRWQSLGTYPVLDLRDSNSYHDLYFESLSTSDKELQKDNFPSPKKISEIIKSDKHYIFVAVPVVGQEDMPIIAKQIKKIRDAYKKTAGVKKADKEIRTFPLPSTRIRKEELERYLDVFDFRYGNQRLKMKEVMKAVNKKRNESVAENESEFFHYQSKAKKIIENVEKGYFPGKY